MMFPTEEAGSGLPAAPKIPSQSKESEGAGHRPERRAGRREQGGRSDASTDRKRKVRPGPFGVTRGLSHGISRYLTAMQVTGRGLCRAFSSCTHVPC